MSREIMQQALDALEFPHDSEWSNKAKAIEALQKALAQPEQEPYCWVQSKLSQGMFYKEKPRRIHTIPLYTAPPKPEQERVCNKDPHLCGFVQCQLSKVCKHIAQPEQEELIQFKDGKWSYVRKPWVGLTDDEKESVYKHADAENHQLSKVVSAVEWLLKNKNTT